MQGIRRRPSSREPPHKHELKQQRGLGITFAADDGSSRALGPAAAAVIEQLELAESDVVDTLRKRHPETVKTFAGEPVGEMRPAFHLETS